MQILSKVFKSKTFEYPKTANCICLIRTLRDRIPVDITSISSKSSCFLFQAYVREASLHPSQVLVNSASPKSYSGSSKNASGTVLENSLETEAGNSSSGGGSSNSKNNNNNNNMPVEQLTSHMLSAATRVSCLTTTTTIIVMILSTMLQATSTSTTSIRHSLLALVFVILTWCCCSITPSINSCQL